MTKRQRPPELTVVVVICLLTVNVFCGVEINDSLTVRELSREERLPKTLFNNFVLHVGPPKTATSTIQCALQSLGDVLEENDGYTILETAACRNQYRSSDLKQQLNLRSSPRGAHTHDNLLLGKAAMQTCAGKISKSGELPACWVDQYLPYFRRQKALSRDTIVSHETMERLVLRPQVFDAISQSLEGTRMTLVVTYRPWFEFVLSGFNQKDAKRRSAKPKLVHWPGQGGRRMVTATEAISLSLEIEDIPFVFTDKIVQMYRNWTSISLKTIDIHEGNPVTSFLCDAVPGATNACERIKNLTKTRKTEVRNRRDSATVFYDMIACDAFMNGIIRSGIGRIPAGEAIKAFHWNELKNRSLPLECPPSDLLDSFLQESLRRESIVFPRHSDKREKRHRERFAKAVAKHEFCTVNVTKVLENEIWLQFLKEL